MQKRTVSREMMLFFIMVGAAALGNGLSDSVYSNYFKEVFHVNTTQRAFIEFPRELPGLLCALIIASLSALGDAKISTIAQAASCLGLMAMGVFSPSYGVMLVFLFINSTGMHMFMPLSDSMGMALAEPGMVGRRMGQYASLKMVMNCAAGLVVFFGFRYGVFSFATPVNALFMAGTGAFLIAIAASLLLVRSKASTVCASRKAHLVFRKRYKHYYLLVMLQGIQKQVAYVFGSWVIVDLLLKKADVMSLLLVSSSFISIFFMNMIGRWMDRYGIKRMMYVDALTFIIIYSVYGLLVWGITSKLLPGEGWPVIAVYALFVMDRLSMQIGIVRSVYLKSIAVTKDEVTATLSTGVSLDHVVSILAAQVCGFIWISFGPHWVFFTAAFFSLGNLYVAWKLKDAGGSGVAAMVKQI